MAGDGDDCHTCRLNTEQQIVGKTPHALATNGSRNRGASFRGAADRFDGVLNLLNELEARSGPSVLIVIADRVFEVACGFGVEDVVSHGRARVFMRCMTVGPS